MRQGTPDWKAARVGHFTASRGNDLLTHAKSKADREAGKLGQTALSYLYEVLGEILTGQPADDYGSVAMRWGTDHEDDARTVYAIRNDAFVQECGFFEHPTLRFVGASPDGLVGDDGLLEIKCPFTTKEHVRTLVNREVPDQYRVQVQWQLWVTDRKWSDFVSYDPRVSDVNLDLVVVRVERDEELIAEMEAAVARASAELQRMIAVITGGTNG